MKPALVILNGKQKEALNELDTALQNANNAGLLKILSKYGVDTNKLMNSVNEVKGR